MRDDELDIEKEVLEDLFAAKVVAKVATSNNDESMEGDAADAGVSSECC
jgi:hypothetical protein